MVLLSFNLIYLKAQNKLLYFNDGWEQVAYEDLATYYCECTLDKNELLQGLFICYNIQSGTILKKYTFENNLFNGEVIEFYNNGNVKLKAEYNLGVPINNWIQWDELGDTIFYRSYTNDKVELKQNNSKVTPYEELQNKYKKPSEPAIYGTECLKLDIEDQRYTCSDSTMNNFFLNAPVPPQYKTMPQYIGKQITCKLHFFISKKGIVDDAEILESTGDQFLDELALAHVLNMVPFEAAKSYGMPIGSWKEATLVFNFTKD